MECEGCLAHGDDGIRTSECALTHAIVQPGQRERQPPQPARGWSCARSARSTTRS